MSAHRALEDPVAEHVAARMRSQGRRDTGPELALRREIHRRGLRFRVDRAPLEGRRFRADLVFGPSRVAVFVDGCFWHGCAMHAVPPKNNGKWWADKLAGNRARDERTDRDLTSEGWLSLRVWEHETLVDAADRVEAAVLARRPR